MEDGSHGYSRQEIVCAKAQGHELEVHSGCSRSFNVKSTESGTGARWTKASELIRDQGLGLWSGRRGAGR